MKDDRQENSRRRRYFRYAVFALTSLVVASLGFVLIPRESAPPAAPPFSEQARASAYSDALSLRAAVLGVEGSAGPALPAPAAAALERAVTLLTVQARALMMPADESGNPAPTRSSTAPGNVPPPSTAPALASDLQASGAQRLKDAETADGGMARLLAGAGMAQLLAAEEIAAAAGGALAPLPQAGASDASPQPGSCVPGTGPAEADLGSALAAAVEAERELVYAYQAALGRLDPATVGPASSFLAQHENLGGQAEGMSRVRCAEVPPAQPGYALSEAFLADPASELGTLEAGTLPLYGDVVALSEGSERVWALSALQSAARRTVHWGASAGPVPGVVLDEAVLPQLQGAAGDPSAGRASSTGTP